MIATGRGGRFISGRSGCKCLNETPAGRDSVPRFGNYWLWKHVGVSAAASCTNEAWINHQATTLISSLPFTNGVAAVGHFN